MAEFRIQRRDSSNGMTDIRFVETSASSVTFSAITADTFYGDGANLSGITDTFTTGFTFNPTTYELTLSQNEGQPNLTSNLAVLASDVYVVSGVYNPSTGIVTYTNSSGGTFQVSGFTTGMTDSYTTSANLNGETIQFNNNIQGVNLYSVSLSPVLSGKTNLSLFNTHTGDTNNPHQTSFNNLTNTAHTHTLSEITDFNPYSGNVQSQLNSKIENGINAGGSNEIFSGKSGTDFYFRTISGGSNTTISTVGDVVKVDVTIPPDTNTFVTGFTYDNANTFTISRNDDVNLNATINTVTALTVTDYVDFTTNTTPTAVSGRTYFDRGENALSYFPNTNNNDVTINVGQESVIRVYNGTGQQINNGQACHITSTQPSVNGVPSVVLAIATGNTTTDTKYEVSGIATHDIPNGTEGFITALGVVRGLNITGATEGVEIYLSDITPGGLIFTPPSNISSRRSQIGHVITTGTTDAKIIVEINNETGFSNISNTELSIIAENSFSTGIRVGGEMSINSGDSSLVDISAGSGVIVDNYTDPLNPVVTNVSWDTITGVSLTYLTANTGSYLFIEPDGVTIKQNPNTTPPNESDFRDYLFLGLVGHASKSFINNIFNSPTQLVSPVNQHVDLTSAIGPFSISGNRLSNIPNSLELEKSAGRSFFYGGNFHTDPKTPSQLNTGILSGSTLIYAKGDKILGPSGTTVDTDNYDPNGLGVITSIPGNNYTTHRIWHSPKNNLLIFQYGQYVYANQATARDEIGNETYVVPQGLDFAAYLIAVLIVKGAEPDLNEALIVPQGKFSGTGGGGGGSVDTLQTAYNNSTSPEIITDTTRNAVDFRIGTGTDSDNLVTFQQTSGVINAYVKGTGDAKFNSLSGDSLSATTLTATTIYPANVIKGKFFDTELVVNVRKSSPGSLSANTAVYLKGYDAINDVYTVEYADASNPAAMPSVGILDENVTDTVTGVLTIFGVHENIDTTAWAEGDPLYVGTTPGEITNVQPTGATVVQVFGLVITQALNGRIFRVVTPTNSLPNLPSQRFWMGSPLGIPSATTVNNLVEETVPVAGDYFFIWDNSSSTHKKLNVTNLPGGFTSFDISGDTGSQTIINGETILLSGGQAIKTTVSPTDVATFDLDITGTTSLATPITGDKLVVWDATDNTHKNIDWNQLPGAAGGEVNTASNVGGGNGVFAQKVGVDLQFRSLVAGTNINISSGTTELTISSTGGGGGSSRVTGSTQTTGSTPTEVDKINILKDNATNIIEVYVKAYESGAAEYGVWKRTLTVTKVSGTVVIREVNADVDKTSPGLNANSISFNVNGGDIDIDVTGINATTIDWESAYEIIL